MSRKILIKCKECGKEFDKAKKEYDRQIRKGRTHDSFFCGRQCQGVYLNKNMSQKSTKKRSRSFSKAMMGNKRRYKGKFTETLRRVRERIKNKPYNTTDIDDEYLTELWEKQGGKCVYSGVDIMIPNYKTPKTPFVASLDRLDSSKGYVKGNVQFVSLSMNYAKSDFTDEEFREFLTETLKT